MFVVHFDFLAHRRLLKAQLEEDEQQFVVLNMNKHRLVQWLNFFGAICIYYSLKAVHQDQLSTVISALIAPVMIMGTAWFAVSFGAIPRRLIECSIEITFWMYCAFNLSFSRVNGKSVRLKSALCAILEPSILNHL